MKRKLVLLIGVLCIYQAVWAAPTNETNIALDISRSIRSTFQNTGGLFDGVISNEPQFRALSGDFYKKIQEVYVALPKPFYVRQIVVYFDKATYYPNYTLQISDDGINLWEVGAESRKETVKGTSIVHTYTVPGALVSALRLAIQGDRKDNPKKPPVIVQEIQIYPQMDQRAVIESVGSLFTDAEAFVYPKTNIQTSVFLRYKPEGVTGSYSVGGYGRLRESACAVGLAPDTRYDYFVQTQDFNANVIESKQDIFTTRPQSLSFKAGVAGTFINTGASPNILVDGILDQKPADSGSIYEQDQELVLDLGMTKQASSVVVYWGRLAFSRDYSVQGSVDGKTWEALGKNIDAGQGYLGRTRGAFGGSPINVMETKFSQKPVRYIKVVMAKDSDFYHKHTNWENVQVYEVKVF